MLEILCLYVAKFNGIVELYSQGSIRCRLLVRFSAAFPAQVTYTVHVRIIMAQWLAYYQHWSSSSLADLILILASNLDLHCMTIVGQPLTQASPHGFFHSSTFFHGYKKKKLALV